MSQIDLLAYAYMAVLALLLLLGSFLFGQAVSRLRRMRLGAGVTRGVMALPCLAGAGLMAAAALNLLTYQRLTAESSVANLSFDQLGPQRFRTRIVRPSGEGRTVELRGDQWRVEARVLKWHGLATVAGLDTLYRLERLSGRYRDPEEARHRQPSVYALSSKRGITLWRIAVEHPGWVPWVDAFYGSATYLPMADGARFEVRLNPNGLLARPVNSAARGALSHW